MIQLANDPSATQTTYRPAQGESKGSSLASQGKRSGHAWPFLSRQTSRPARQESQKPAASDSGS